MRYFICLVILFSSLSELHADHGLHFKSNEVAKELRTGVDITHKSNISYNTSFSIHFAISFRDSDTHYGDILSLKEINGNKLIQVNFRDPDLFVIYNKRETKFHCNFKELGIQNNRWISFELKIDAKNENLQLLFGDTILNTSIKFPQNSEFALSLGVVNKYGFVIDEVPSISIKDLSIRINGSPKHLWPFRKTDSNLLRDILSSRTAKIYNPDWVVDYHNKWAPLDSFTFSTIPSMAFDSQKEILYFVMNNGDISSYDLRTKQFSTLTVHSGYPSFEKSQQVIINKGEILSYSFNRNRTSSYNFKTHQWSKNKKSSLDDIPKFWHHNKLIHPITKEITTICGYGFYSYYNKIQSFNKESNTWNELKFTGDTIQPRYLASFGSSSKDSNIGYLFGGLGNSLGKQILGKEFYYDLYKIDFKKKCIKKLWNYKCKDDKFQYLPVNTMITDNDSCFYTIMFPALKRNTYLKVVKGFINNSRLVFIGDSIPYDFLDVESFADLYYWKSENKLIALTSHLASDNTYHVNLHSISYAPDEEAELNLDARSLPLSIKIFYSCFALFLLILALIIRKKIRAKHQSEKELVSHVSTFDIEPIISYKIPLVNAILLFGGFQVFDSKSKNISYRFSPTLKELFLLILLYSTENGKGISSRRIQEYLWPDKPESKAKNNRGVNIKKLRSILEDISGLEIIYDNNYWKLTSDDSIFCDLIHITNEIKKFKESGNIEKLEEILQILKRGTLLRDIFPEWLDSFKDKNTGKIVNFLENIVSQADLNTSLRLRISNVIFEFDQMNETALRVKCSLLSSEGKHSLSVETYENYKKLYSKFYNEEYKFSFKDIAKDLTVMH
ncbi:hypothetical protein [Ancylomarina longa]|uniref:DNA-binding transcriptional activator n=1 Tax=Ancylomarina longa TaxID=2487017 RepID=A0A434AXF7_9BACT|nr:hypothetical protein [Ancylomarina longa]RUT79098.1 hypothetical protein DLK05_04575 [Ancylomarina longa]